MGERIGQDTVIRCLRVCVEYGVEHTDLAANAHRPPDDRGAAQSVTLTADAAPTFWRCNEVYMEIICGSGIDAIESIRGRR